MEDKIITSFKDRFNEILQLRKIKPVDLSRITGISKPQISSYMSGKYLPKQETIYKFAQVLNCSVGWLIGFDVPMNDLSDLQTSFVPIPILGIVKAGYDYLAEENIIGNINVDRSELGNIKEYFALRVKGDSMFPAIQENDIALVHYQKDCESNDIAIVLINGNDAPIKRVIKTNDGIVLQPQNPNYELQTYSKKEIKNIPIEIVGVVKQIIRKF